METTERDSVPDPAIAIENITPSFLSDTHCIPSNCINHKTITFTLLISSTRYSFSRLVRHYVDLKPNKDTVIVAITSFVLVLGGLTVHRITRFEFSESIQSLIVQIGLVVIVGGLLYHFYTDGQFVDGWLISFSPTLGFTLNLFFAGPGNGPHVLLFYALVSAIVVATVITVLTFAIVELVSGVEGSSNESLN